MAVCLSDKLVSQFRAGIEKLKIEGNMALFLQLQRVIKNGSVNLISTLRHSSSYCSSRSFSKSTPYVVKVGIPEFLNGIGKGVESHVAKLDSEIGDFQKLLVTRTLKLKKLGIPCKHCLCVLVLRPVSTLLQTLTWNLEI
ncbi:hypothetical protein L195_g014742 [Trifolium pratense]|uniref:Small ribosomal subunit protein mS41 SAM domain-containing protein n=1 Tax=Trifolium pratense TaxID=57577 RepID=A0A2K3PRS1_TRIPR|nr:hypothetical protein L195_g014742 [Trifolium pratense]